MRSLPPAALLFCLSLVPAIAFASPASRAIVVAVPSPQGAFDAAHVASWLRSQYGVLADTQPGSELHGTVTAWWNRDDSTLTVSFQASNEALVSRVVTAESTEDLNVRQVSAVAFALIQQSTAVSEEAGPARPLAPPPQPSGEPETIAASAALFYPLATNMHQPDASTHFDINLLHGRVGALDGVQLGLANVVKRNAIGMQLSPFGVNYVGLNLGGLQAALVGNLVSADGRGLQLSLGGNYVGGHLTGLQTSLLVNVARRGFTGAQWSAVNVAPDESKGIQMGLLNVHANSNFVGAQIGLLNIGSKIKGTQVGLINIADDIEGIPVGLISVSANAGIHPTVFASLGPVLHAGIKFSTRYTYTTLLLAVEPLYTPGEALTSATSARVGPGYLVGARIPVFSFLSFNTDIGATYLYGGALDLGLSHPSEGAEDVFQVKLRGNLTFQFAKHFSAFIGGGINFETRLKNGVGPSRVYLRPDVFGGLEF